MSLEDLYLPFCISQLSQRNIEQKPSKPRLQVGSEVKLAGSVGAASFDVQTLLKSQ